MAVVRLENVCKTYPSGFQAVRDASLDIADGEFVVLVGPSGCGKSTTLRMVAGLESISQGTITIGNRVVNDVAPKDRDIAMVFQSYALYPHMTVHQNLAFALRQRRVPTGRVNARVHEVAEMLGLMPMLDRRPGQLSGGQRQRVALGRAIVREPAAYLFDEPLSNLDAKLRASMRTELKSLHQRLATTTIYVTHDQEEAMTLGDRIVVMDEGVIQQVGTPLEVFRRPTTRFVASFIGSPHMNFFEGHVRRRGDALVFLERGEGPAAIELVLPSSVASDGAIADDRPLTLGVRPQHFRPITPDMPADRACVRPLVHTIDPLGDDADIVFQTPTNARAIARASYDTAIRPGRPLALCVDPAGVYLFESEGRQAALA